MHPARTLLTGLLTLLAGACVGTPETRVPMPVDRGQAVRQSDTLVIFLPGRGSREDAFREKGFFDDLQTNGVDVVSADAHMGYYIEESVTDRLHEDIIQPARDEGYEHIWLAGLSMGGMGAVLYAEHYPGEIDGMILLAPYPGDSDLTEAIRESGGLREWDGTAASEGQAYQREAWRRLKADIRAGAYPIVLGFGEKDRFAEGHRLLADQLPASRVFTEEGGGHNWKAWEPIWDRIMAAGWPRKGNGESAAGQ